MTRNTKLLIGAGITIVILVILFVVFNKKTEVKPLEAKTNEPAPGSVPTVDGYTREQYAYMGYSKADIDLLFI
jgi:hypothetical protein